MTEYDYSPAAYERHLATQHRIANWVSQTEGHRPEFGNALQVVPAPVTQAFPNPAFDTRGGKNAHSTITTGPTPARSSQIQRLPSQSHSTTRHHSSSSLHNLYNQSQSGRSQACSAYALPTSSATYIYAPSGWVASAGLVMLPLNGQPPSAVVSDYFTCSCSFSTNITSITASAAGSTDSALHICAAGARIPAPHPTYGNVCCAKHVCHSSDTPRACLCGSKNVHPDRLPAFRVRTVLAAYESVQWLHRT